MNQNNNIFILDESESESESKQKNQLESRTKEPRTAEVIEREIINTIVSISEMYSNETKKEMLEVEASLSKIETEIKELEEQICSLRCGKSHGFLAETEQTEIEQKIIQQKSQQIILNNKKSILYSMLSNSLLEKVAKEIDKISISMLIPERAIRNLRILKIKILEKYVSNVDELNVDELNVDELNLSGKDLAEIKNIDSELLSQKNIFIEQMNEKRILENKRNLLLSNANKYLIHFGENFKGEDYVRDVKIIIKNENTNEEAILIDEECIIPEEKIKFVLDINNSSALTFKVCTDIPSFLESTPYIFVIVVGSATTGTKKLQCIDGPDEEENYKEYLEYVLISATKAYNILHNILEARSQTEELFGKQTSSICIYRFNQTKLCKEGIFDCSIHDKFCKKLANLTIASKEILTKMEKSTMDYKLEIQCMMRLLKDNTDMITIFEKNNIATNGLLLSFDKKIIFKEECPLLFFVVELATELNIWPDDKILIYFENTGLIYFAIEDANNKNAINIADVIQNSIDGVGAMLYELAKLFKKTLDLNNLNDLLIDKKVFERLINNTISLNYLFLNIIPRLGQEDITSFIITNIIYLKKIITTVEDLKNLFYSLPVECYISTIDQFKENDFLESMIITISDLRIVTDSLSEQKKIEIIDQFNKNYFLESRIKASVDLKILMDLLPEQKKIEIINQFNENDFLEGLIKNFGTLDEKVKALSCVLNEVPEQKKIEIIDQFNKNYFLESIVKTSEDFKILIASLPKQKKIEILNQFNKNNFLESIVITAIDLKNLLISLPEEKQKEIITQLMKQQINFLENLFKGRMTLGITIDGLSIGVQIIILNQLNESGHLVKLITNNIKLLSMVLERFILDNHLAKEKYIEILQQFKSIIINTDNLCYLLNYIIAYNRPEKLQHNKDIQCITIISYFEQNGFLQELIKTLDNLYQLLDRITPGEKNKYILIIIKHLNSINFLKTIITTVENLGSMINKIYSLVESTEQKYIEILEQFKQNGLLEVIQTENELNELLALIPTQIHNCTKEVIDLKKSLTIDSYGI